MSRLPDQLRRALPEELKEAEIVGVDVADVADDLRLWGPPGTGKSTQSALRTATRAHEEGLQASDMTVVTYRKSLAGVVRERMMEWGVFDKDADYEYWTTIHAAASRATNFHERFSDDKNGLEGMVGASAEYRFCSKLNIHRKPSKPWLETRWTVFKDLYDYGKNNLLDVGHYQHVPDGALRELKSDVVADQKLKAFYEQWGTTPFEKVAQKWESFKDHHNIYDFHEQLTAALTGDLPRMRHVVIDEYHDATPLMAAVTERWVQNADVAIVAGDPDQVVNGYAGADPGFFEELNDRVEREMPVVKLDRSWRCPDEHFEAARRVLAEERTPPSLETDGPGKLNRWHTPKFKSVDDGWRTPPISSEGSPVWLWREYGPDMMFLARTQKQADAIATALDAGGVIYRSQTTVGGDWSKRMKILRALEMLESVSPGHETAPDGVESLTETRSGSDLSTYALSRPQANALREHSHGHYLESGWDSYVALLDDGESIPLNDWSEYVTDKWWLRYTNGKSSINELVGLDDRDVEAMLRCWENYEPLPELSDVETTVLTIHASKGAEASNVVVYDGVTGAVTDGMARSAMLRENEARTWYVALTRASERMHVIRDAWEYTEPYLPYDLEPRAAAVAKELRGGASD